MNRQSRLQSILIACTCLGVVATIFALAGCGGDGGSMVSGIGGSLGIGGGSSGGGLGSSFLGGSEGQYVDAAIKAGKAVSIGEREEIEMGQGVAISLTNTQSLLDDPSLNDYVMKVGLAVAMHSARNDYTYVFGVLDSPQVAAYSGPRGYIFVTRGALAAMQDEAELAGVLAHEVAHVVRRHGLESVKKRGLLSAAVTAAGAESGLGPFTNVVGGMTEDLLSKGFDQGQETESDRDAVTLLALSGYDPASYARFLDRMKGMGASKGGLLSTHPGIDQRIRNVNKQIGDAKASGGQTNKDRFTRATASVRQGA